LFLCFEAELEQKVFFYPDDAHAVRDIMHAFVLKRMLLDGIEAGDNGQICRVVERLQRANLAHVTLNQPVNAALDTPLHVAVRQRNTVAARVLVDSGASSTRQNLRGDTPCQYFMLPRSSKAARLIRATPGHARPRAGEEGAGG